MGGTTMKVQVNFGSVFATIKDEKSLKEVANSISMQLKDAYTKRLAELTKGVKTEKKVEIKVENKAEGKVEKTKPAPKETKAEKKAEKKSAPKADKKAKDEKEFIVAITDKKAVKALGLSFVPYSEKCWVLVGNTKPLRADIKKLGGSFNSRLKVEGGAGWVFKKDDVKKAAKALGIKVAM